MTRHDHRSDHDEGTTATMSPVNEVPTTDRTTATPGRRWARIAAAVAAGGAMYVGGTLFGAPAAGAAVAAEPTPVPFIFSNHATGNCLDDSANGLRAFSCNRSEFQQWVRTFANDTGTWELRNAATGACLDHSTELGLRAAACNGLPYQQWTYLTVNGSLTNLQTGQCVDDSANGLRAFDCNNSDFQKWDPFG